MKKKILFWNLFLVLLVLACFIPLIIYELDVFLEIILPIVIGLLFLMFYISYKAYKAFYNKAMSYFLANNFLGYIFILYSDNARRAFNIKSAFGDECLLEKFLEKRIKIIEGPAEEIIKVLGKMDLKNSAITSINLYGGLGGLESNEVYAFKQLLLNSKITNVTIMNYVDVNTISNASYENLITALDGTSVTSVRNVYFGRPDPRELNPLSHVQNIPDNITHVDLFVSYIRPNIILDELQVIKDNENITSIGLDLRFLDFHEDALEKIFNGINNELQESKVTSVEINSIGNSGVYSSLAEFLNKNKKISRLAIANFSHTLLKNNEQLEPCVYIQKLVLGKDILKSLSEQKLDKFLELFPNVTEVKVVDDNGMPVKSTHDKYISNLMNGRKKYQALQWKACLEAAQLSDDVAGIMTDYLGLPSPATKPKASDPLPSGGAHVN